MSICAARRSTAAAPATTWFFAAAILVPLLLAACDEKAAPQAPAPAPSVGVTPAAVKGVSQAYNFVGRIKAIDTVQLRARVEGFLEKVLFREGDDVKSGQLRRTSSRRRSIRPRPTSRRPRPPRSTPSSNTTARSSW